MTTMTTMTTVWDDFNTAVQAIDLSALDGAGLGDLAGKIGLTRSVLDGLEARVAAGMRRLGASEASAAETLRQRTGCSTREAKHRTRRAETLEKMPNVAQALASGRLTGEHASALARAAAETSPEAVDRDAGLLAEASSMPADAASGKARDWVRRRQTDDDLQRLHQWQRRNRSLLFAAGEGGMIAGIAKFDRVSGAQFQNLVEALADRLYRADGGRDNPNARTRAQCRHDALLTLVGIEPAPPRPAVTSAPLNGQDAPLNGQDASLNGQDAPLYGQDAPINGQDTTLEALSNGKPRPRLSALRQQPLPAPDASRATEVPADPLFNPEPIPTRTRGSLPGVGSCSSPGGSPEAISRAGSGVGSGIGCGGSPEAIPGIGPGVGLDAIPGIGPGGSPEAIPGIGPGVGLDAIPGIGPGGSPEAIPGIGPGVGLDAIPGIGPGGSPEAIPGIGPGVGLDAIPGIGPGGSPEAIPGIGPGVGLDAIPGIGPGGSPEAIPGIGPGVGLDTRPGLSPAPSPGCTCGRGFGPKAQLCIVMDVTYLATNGERGRCEIPGVGAIARSELERLGCDPEIYGILFDERGLSLHHGRKTRRVSPQQWRVLLARDRGCVMCGANPLWCQAHHVKYWSLGGPTDIDNLALLCHAHHRWVHDNEITLRRGPNGWHAPASLPSPRRPSRQPVHSP